MQIIETKGNKDLLDRGKTLFLCSKMTPIGLYGDVFRWTDSLTERDCIACFNSTVMESEVLKALLVARVPTVLFVMNRFTDVNNIQMERALKENRLLIVVLRRDEPQGKGTTPRLRNEYVMSLCQHIVCGYVNMNGSVFSLLAGRKNVEKLIGEGGGNIAAEPETQHERWTVAQDKVLLRMYYEDMGIHAIHKQMQRSYAAINARIHSMAQSEDLLKGREFEDYVLTLFDIRKDGPLVLQEWQGDKSYGTISPENNSNPDFVFRYQGKEFAIECKWRERLDRDLRKNIFSSPKLDNYRNFSVSRKMPVTIFLGVGGEPCNPELLYVIPLERIDEIVSNNCSIMAFLCQSRSLDVSLFLRTESPKEKAYTLDEKRKEYANAYKPWCREDDEQLLALCSEGKNVKELSQFFKRNEGAIRSRINKLSQWPAREGKEERNKRE